MRVPALDAVNVPLLAVPAPTPPAAPADDLLVRAVQALAGVCDGAQTLDGQGYDGTDAKFGNRLALLPVDLWTAPMRAEAHRMLAKYQRQLTRFGIDYATIPAPAAVESEEARESRQDARRRLKHAQDTQVHVRIASRPDGPILELDVPYSGVAVAAMRDDLPGRRWNGTLNTAPAEPSVARAALALAHRFNWRVADEVRELAARAPAASTASASSPTPKRSVQLEMGMLAVRFGYRDPEFNSIKNLVKAVPGRAWDGAGRAWRVPTTPASCAGVQSLAERFGFDVAPMAAEAITSSAGAAIQRAEASRALEAEFDVETMALPLRPFQRAGVAYATRERRVFIADEMGLGKTPQALATVESVGAYPALFVVPDSLRRNWEREAAKFLPHRSTLVVLGQTPRADYEADIVIVGYSVLSFHVEELETEGFRAVVLDESHLAKNPKASRTKAVLRLGEMAGVEVKLCLSGTPLPNKPAELLPQLQFLGRLADMGGRRDFWYRYCRDYLPVTVLTQLHEQLRQTCYVRRTKADVMPELPAVQVSAVDADLEGRAKRDLAGANDELMGALVELMSATEATERNQARGAAIGALSSLRRIVGVSKIPAAVEWIREFHASGGGKLVVFAHHVEVQEGIAEAFPGCARIAAGMGASLMDEVDRFQTDPGCETIVVSLMAGSVGLTLTAASHMLVVELPWVPKDLHQAHARCHGRVNDAHGLNAYHLLAPGTLDERVAEILERKLRVTTAVQDGEILDEVEASRSIVGELIESLLAELATPVENE